MLRRKVATLLCLLLSYGCSGGDEPAGGSESRSTECAASQTSPPQWQQSAASKEIRVVIADASVAVALVQLKSKVDTFLVENNPGLNSQSRARVSDLTVEYASQEQWLDGNNCQTWSTAYVAKESIVNEVVFLQLNQQLAQNIPYFRQLGTDPDKSMRSRSGFLTTALLMLESLDSRYLSQTMAVNYERELIQSKLDELTETSATDFQLLLENALASKTVDAATRTRASIEKFASIDPDVLFDGLRQMDNLIKRLQAQTVRARVESIRADGLSAGYQQAEAAVELLAQPPVGSSSEQVVAAINELNQYALTQRSQEIEHSLNQQQNSDASVDALRSLISLIDALEERHGMSVGHTEQRSVLASALAEKKAAEVLVAQQACAKIVLVSSYTQFEFSQAGTNYSNRNRRLVIEGTKSTITLTSNLDADVQIVEVVQSIGSEEGGVIVSGSSNEIKSVAAAGEASLVVDLAFDNEHPAARTCLEPLVQRSFECRLEVVTNVSVARHHACPPATVSVTEQISLVSAHKPGNYTIKLLRNE